MDEQTTELIESAALKGPRLTSLDVHNALRQRHPSPEWCYIAELRTQAGFNDFHGVCRWTQTRSIDAFAIHTWPSKGFRRVAYEIKVDRNDWLRELEDPAKHMHAFYLANEFWYALGPGVGRFGPGMDQAKLRTQLEGAGVLVVHETGTVEVVSHAHKHEAWPMPTTFVVSLLRAAMGQYIVERTAAEERVRAQLQLEMFPERVEEVQL